MNAMAKFSDAEMSVTALKLLQEDMHDDKTFGRTLHETKAQMWHRLEAKLYSTHRKGGQGFIKLTKVRFAGNSDFH